VEKYGRGGQATEGDMSHALCVLDIKGYKLILRIRSIYCFFFLQHKQLRERASMLRYTYTVHVHSLSCNSLLYFVDQFVLRILVDLSEVKSVVE